MGAPNQPKGERRGDVFLRYVAGTQAVLNLQRAIVAADQAPIAIIGGRTVPWRDRTTGVEKQITIEEALSELRLLSGRVLQDFDKLVLSASVAQAAAIKAQQLASKVLKDEGG